MQLSLEAIGAKLVPFLLPSCEHIYKVLWLLTYVVIDILKAHLQWHEDVQHFWGRLAFSSTGRSFLSFSVTPLFWYRLKLYKG